MKTEPFQNDVLSQTAEGSQTPEASYSCIDGPLGRCLFHFTRLEYLSSILAHGIDSGYTPINHRESVPGVCLTEIGEPSKQAWTCGLPKNGFRISVELKNDDPLLLSFGQFAKRFRISKRDARNLCRSGDGHPDKWSVYLGNIPVSAIRGVWFSPLRRFLTRSELPAFKNIPHIRGTYPSFAGHIYLTKDEAFRRAGLVENGRAA